MKNSLITGRIRLERVRGYTPPSGAFRIVLGVDDFLSCVEGARRTDDGKVEVFVNAARALLLTGAERQPLVFRITVEKPKEGRT